MLIVFILLNLFQVSVKADDCGPIGFNAESLLGPSYWFFDLNHALCPPIPSGSFVNTTVANISSCRIYFNLCKHLSYQCDGTACINYIDTKDFVMKLGSSLQHPFKEGDNEFKAVYHGDQFQCGGGLTNIQTIFSFKCDNTSWPRNVQEQHGGSKAPSPYNVTFDVDNCKYTFMFKYDGACYKVPKGDTTAKNISTGSLILILFFPGIVLYFILGALVNRGRGHSGKDLIPHRSFWGELPDLIMDGFAFTMAIITCRKEDRYMKDYETMNT